MKIRKLGYQARKRFGQNFLEDQSVIEHMLGAINPSPDDTLIEIGPGLGALTKHLLVATQGKLTLIELDRDLVPILRAQFLQYPQLVIYQADALNFDFSTLRSPQAQDHSDLRIVGNLPYNISTALIFHLLSFRTLIKDMYFMLQKEVVLRLAAKAGNSAYGRLGIMAQYYCEIAHLFDVSPEAFRPIPKVDSAVVRLIPRPAPLVAAINENHLQLVLKTAFQQRRKTLRNTLKNLIDVAAIESMGIDPGTRPEQLTLETFVALSNHYTRCLESQQ